MSFYATLRGIVGTKTIEVPIDEGATVLDLARILAQRYPALAGHIFDGQAGQDAISRSVHFMIDGRNARWLPEGVQTPLRPEQTIDLFPPTAGG